MRIRNAAALVLALTLPVLAPESAAFAQAANDSGGATRADPQPEAEAFARTATAAGLFEIETSRIALEQATNPAIKAFAQKMINDHTAANEQLRQIAGVMPLPTAPDKPHADLIVALRNAGTEFDRVYVQQQVDAHREAVTLFTEFSTTGPNGVFRAFAAKTLPALQAHQEMAGQLVDKVQ